MSVYTIEQLESLMSNVEQEFASHLVKREEKSMADFSASMPVRTMDGPLDVNVVSDVSNKLNSMRSMNNRLVVEAYKKGPLDSTINNGFAFINQKMTVKGLTVLMDAKLNDGTIVLKGSTAYIKEEDLYTQLWATKILESDTLKVPFIIVDMNNVQFISPPTGTVA